MIDLILRALGRPAMTNSTDPLWCKETVHKILLFSSTVTNQLEKKSSKCCEIINYLQSYVTYKKKKMYIAKKAKHSLSLWVIKLTDWSKCFFSTTSTPLGAGVDTRRAENQSLCAYKDRSRRASIKYTDTHVDKERGRQIQKVFTNLVSCCTSHGGGGETNSHSAFGDLDECCIGSMTKNTESDAWPPPLNAPPAPSQRTRLGGFKVKKESTIFFIFLSHRNDVKPFFTSPFNHKYLYTFNLRLIISL